MRIGMPMMNDQISDIGNPGEGVGEDEDGVVLIKQRVTEQQQRSREAQPPEPGRHDDAFEFFSGIPLHQEAREKDGVF